MITNMILFKMWAKPIMQVDFIDDLIATRPYKQLPAFVSLNLDQDSSLICWCLKSRFLHIFYHLDCEDNSYLFINGTNLEWWPTSWGQRSTLVSQARTVCQDKDRNMGLLGQFYFDNSLSAQQLPCLQFTPVAQGVHFTIHPPEARRKNHVLG